MLPSYDAAVKQEQGVQPQSQPQQQPQPQQQRDGTLGRPELPQTYQRLGQQSLASERQRQQPDSLQQQQQQQHSARDGTLELNLPFLQSPAGGLLASSSILGLLLSICGAVPLWNQLAGGYFCVYSGLWHFCGCSFLFFSYLYNFANELPWFCRPLIVYYYLVSAGISLLAFVYAASSSALHSAAVASAVFSFLAMTVDIVLIVLSYLALKMGYAEVIQSPRRQQDHAEVGMPA